MTGQKTYSHLAPLKRMPTEYELLSSKLLWHVGRGFEVEMPLSEWYRRHQAGASWKCPDWESFSDPRETTYSKYTALQSAKESFLDGLLESVETAGYDAGLPDEWIRWLSGVLGPLRYPCHGLQMAACYLGSMAPSGRIALAALFQAGDEMRRVQRLAYRTRQLQKRLPGFGEDARARWQEDPLWQPLREALERLLVSYDWDESFVALNLAVKPAFDELFMSSLAKTAWARRDPVLAEMLASLNEDCRWHRQWSRALLRTALGGAKSNDPVLRRWLGRWRPVANRATAPFSALFGDAAANGAPEKISTEQPA